VSTNTYFGLRQPGAENAGLKDFWELYEAHYDQMQQELVGALDEHSEFSALLRSTPRAQMEEQNRAARESLRRAVQEGDWETYTEELRAQGDQYAQAGISFSAWFEVMSLFRGLLRPRLFAAFGATPDRLQDALEAMNRFLDLALASIGQGYLESKEQIIHRQQAGIREMSTPVLQLRERLLLLPIIGILDTQRARQLTEQLLLGIRAARARAVVMDVTGVPAVDSGVANHLLQTVQAARLLGARVIVTGLSADTAQTLVRIGVDLSSLNTVGDLQGGIEEAERLLGFETIAVRRSDARGSDAHSGRA
jgi:rsbT co-antagonist protein RsbR